MTWLSELEAPTRFEAVLQHRPALLTRFRAFYRTFWSDGLVPRRVLELCRLRIAAIHDCESEWVVRDPAVALDADALAALRAGRFGGFSGDEQAALAVAEQVPYAHHHVTDADVERLTGAYGAAGAVALLTALAFFDVVARLKLVLDVQPESARLDSPPAFGEPWGEHLM
jgi:alkylhydroperoxidase family enzyme